MRDQDHKFRTSVGSFSASSVFPGPSSAFKIQSGSSSLNIGQLRSGAKEKASGGGGGGGGSTSLGFIAINCIVLGIVGYTFMTDDTSATTDATGGFSFFKADDRGSFAVKPGKRVSARKSQFDWSSKKTRSKGHDYKAFASLNGLSFGSPRSTKMDGQSAGSTFLAPGQIEELFSILPNISGPSSTYEAYRPALGGGSGSRDQSEDAHVRAFDTTLSSTARYQRYSVSTLQEPQTQAERNTLAIENAANGGAQNSYRILKGRLANVTGQGSRDGKLNLHIAHGTRAEITKIALAGVENGRADASTYAIDWSSDMASNFYLLGSGLTEATSTRLRVLAARAVSGQTGSTPGQMALRDVSDLLSSLVERPAQMVYVVEDNSRPEAAIVKAILLQDLAERRWQVIRLKQLEG